MIIRFSKLYLLLEISKPHEGSAQNGLMTTTLSLPTAAKAAESLV